MKFKLHRFEPAYTQKMDIYAFLLYSEKSDKLNVLEKWVESKQRILN
jgi:hypothetical protein